MGAVAKFVIEGAMWLGAGYFLSDTAKSGAEIAKSGEQSVDHVAKAAPWIVGGLAVWLVMSKRGR